jgi:hypothetical protein
MNCCYEGELWQYVLAKSASTLGLRAHVLTSKSTRLKEKQISIAGVSVLRTYMHSNSVITSLRGLNILCRYKRVSL